MRIEEDLTRVRTECFVHRCVMLKCERISNWLLIECLQTTYDWEFSRILRSSVEQSSNPHSSSAETGRGNSKRRSDRNEGEKLATYEIQARNLMLALVCVQSTPFARARCFVQRRQAWKGRRCFARNARLPLHVALLRRLRRNNEILAYVY